MVMLPPIPIGKKKNTSHDPFTEHTTHAIFKMCQILYSYPIMLITWKKFKWLALTQICECASAFCVSGLIKLF